MGSTALSASDPGFAPGRLAAIDPFVRTCYLDGGKLPHAQLLIARDGQIAHSRSAFFIDPVERVTMIFMTQLSPSSMYPIRREPRTMIHSALV